MKITHNFVQQDLDALIDNAIAWYNSREDVTNERGAITYVSTNTAMEHLTAYGEYLTAGYTLHPTYPVSAGFTNGVGLFGFYVVKPQALRDSDIEAIKAEVEADYRASLKVKYDAHVASIVSESVARAENEAQRKAEQAHEKLVAKAKADAISALGEFHA
ncbi:hypothetical protein [Pseudomonas sp. S9]|uniref:hypothetical protein n=1 Tax=Pseudomonas sp. S9 TaxID=686578 RepID=UPI000255685D|nr:hypothetical protein [Pseudomonas sp. S9]